ncbi:MAG TPA: hypothetical protein VJ464_10055 [Blastocatellia bacterium]|nr:hypothetical protein [Blastocatellia bacterium]
MITTAWVDPALQIRGQDDLAVRAPCENLYSQLLPGITNVTDRARLYAFYPWLVWATERHQGPLRQKPFQDILRRAECLLTLIGAWHTNQTEGLLWEHGGGLVGRNTLVPVWEQTESGKSIRLSIYATTSEDTGHRYFKNRLGGLGQYYLSTLRELGILGGDARQGVGYSPERGELLAVAFDRMVDRKKFFDVLEQDRVQADDLKALRRFCPCYLTSSKQELEALTDLIFNQEGVFGDTPGENRRKTLGLALDLASRLSTMSPGQASDGLTVDTFRACAYAQSLPDGGRWAVPAPLKAIQEGWQIYQRNELLSIAVQSIFWAGLDKLQKTGLNPSNSEAYRSWFESSFASSVASAFGNSFAGALSQTDRRIPPIESWTHPNHEIQLGFKLGDIPHHFDPDDCHEEVVRAAVGIILTLSVRGRKTEGGYGAYIQSPAYLAPYPINLNSFCVHERSTWAAFTTAGLLGWLSTTWGIETHFRVALRKLRYENRDTFKIRPSEQGLIVVGAPPPVFSHPRLAQALQFLWDLGALHLDPETGAFSITDRGEALKEKCCG